MTTINRIINSFKFPFRKGFLRSIVEYQRAKLDANRKSKATGHRYFCIWNEHSRRLITMTYDAYHGRTDSYRYLRHRGVFRPINRKQFRDGAYYFTSSKNGSKCMSVREQRIQMEILRKKHYA